MWKYIIAWFLMIFVAMANGLFREKFLSNRLTELQAHQISTVSMIVLFGIYVWILFKLWLPTSANQAIIIGVLWLVLTVVFEFLFGHYVVGHSWNKLFHDYNIVQGRVWVLVLIWITISPYIIYQIQK
ncbi:hypothetical protein SAMN06265377_2814 [Flagellimonas pacifica]|uniref:Uncharacterized protein n=1 Tax=Flagellimonas pacifica TaxID=1247520 RepID=A0A285MUX4_9FLAO|nr:hypothetical protein SAMN06265377_2814 [Allomuricauda parva]